ncbi:hypothetical protein ACFXDP_31665, partial [Streptomyces sp. NPDC059374]|uniref:hypothetical protein n=1 Tax=Streptomyces sp. NPDC059374 TaxID=3346814 RepID=UPI003681EBE8
MGRAREHASTHKENSAPPDTCDAGEARIALELLVHGVGGTTPQQMLDDPRTERITGDDTAAVVRRADDVDAESRPGD